MAPEASHEQRAMAESFGIDPERYDRSRPSYPAEMVRRVVRESPGRDVLDVGVGTGISARPFQDAGCRVLGVDVDERMAAFAREHGVDTELGRFEEWDPAGRIFDIVVSGQAWHWVDPVAGYQKAADVLRTDGRLAIFRNDGRPPGVLVERFVAIYEEVLPGTLAARQWQLPEGGRDVVSPVAAAIRESGRFTEPEAWRYDWTRDYTREEWLDELPTTGVHTHLPAETLAVVLDKVGAAVGDGFTMAYTTTVVTATLAR